MKRLRVILLFLLLGAVVNVAVACWIIYLDPSYIAFTDKLYGVGAFTIRRWEQNAPDIFVIDKSSAPFYRDRRGYRVYHVQNSETVDSSISQLREIQAGWPLQCFYWQSWVEKGFGNMRSQDMGGLGFALIPLHAGVNRDRFIYVFPYLPMWHAVIFNTAFFAGLLWLFICGPFVLRCIRRRKRGICVKCAYDLRGADHEACPECGTVPAAGVAS